MPTWKTKAVLLGKKGTGLMTFARRLERELNRLTEDGYNVTVHPVIERGGAILVGQKSNPEEDPLSKLTTALRSVAGPSDGKVGTGYPPIPLSQHSSNIVTFVLDAIGSADGKEQERPIRAALDEVFANNTVSQVHEAADDCERLAEAHEKKYADDPSHPVGCDYPATLRRVRAALKQRLQKELS